MTGYFREHARTSLLCFSLWLAGAILGIYISLREADMTALEEYISDIAVREASFWRIFSNGISANAVFVSVMILSSLSIALLPLAPVLMVFRGFAASLGCALLIRIFSLKGAWTAIGAVVLPLVFALPLQLVAFVSSMDFALAFAASGRASEQRVLLFKKQLLRMLILFSALCLISAFEAIISPYVFLLI